MIRSTHRGQRDSCRLITAQRPLKQTAIPWRRQNKAWRRQALGRPPRSAYRPMSPVRSATNRLASAPHRFAVSGLAAPMLAASSTAAAASPASPRAMAYARALSARVTLPAPSAMLSPALFAARIA